jgi:hypothetical protein
MEIATEKTISICLCIKIFTKIIFERGDFHQNLIFQTDSCGFGYAIPIYNPRMSSRKTMGPLLT